MKLNAANRAFVALVATSVATYLVLGVAALSLVAAIAYEALVRTGEVRLGAHDMRPALVFLLLVGAGTVAGLWSLRRQVAATRRLHRKVRALRVPLPPELVLAAARTRLRRRVDLVDAHEPFSFAYGLILPRVAVSVGLCEAVSREELEAVLEHERYHVVNLDPLKVLIARVLPPVLFFLPALRDVRLRYVAGRELAADRRAMSMHGRVAVAGALYKAVAGPRWSQLGAAAAIGGPDLLDVRVAQLETGAEPAMPRVRKLTAAASTLGIGLLVWSFAAAVASATGPMGSLIANAVIPAVPVGRLDLVVRLAQAVFWVFMAMLVYRGLTRRSR